VVCPGSMTPPAGGDLTSSNVPRRIISVDVDFSYLQDVLESAIAASAAEFGAVHLVLAGDQKTHIAAIVAPLQLPRLPADLTDPTTALGRAALTRQAVFIADTEIEPSYAPHRPRARACGFRAISVTPLIDRRGTVIGYLILVFKQPTRPSALLRRTSGTHARIAAAVVEAGRVKAEFRRRAALGDSNDAKEVEFKAAIRRLRTRPYRSVLVDPVVVLGDHFVTNMIARLETLPSLS
jgi:hypothetical protein